MYDNIHHGAVLELNHRAWCHALAILGLGRLVQVFLYLDMYGRDVGCWLNEAYGAPVDNGTHKLSHVALKTNVFIGLDL